MKSYLQWNEDKYYEAGRERIVSDVQLRWIYSPACNLYVICNDAEMTGSGQNENDKRKLMVKVAYLFRD